MSVKESLYVWWISINGQQKKKIPNNLQNSHVKFCKEVAACLWVTEKVSKHLKKKKKRENSVYVSVCVRAYMHAFFSFIFDKTIWGKANNILIQRDGNSHWHLTTHLGT